MTQTKRIYLQRRRKRHKFVLMGGPQPIVGDILSIEGEEWTVVKTEDTEIILTIPAEARGSEPPKTA